MSPAVPRPPRPLSRRTLLRSAGATAAAVSLGGIAACGDDDGPREAVPPADIDASGFPPLPPSLPPANCSIRSFFTADEAAAVEAFTARLIPGDADDPGAREACVTTYIDQKLARFDSVSSVFSAPVVLDGTDVDVGWYPSIAVDVNDDVHVTYVSATSDDGRNDALLLLSDSEGSAQTPELALMMPSGTFDAAKKFVVHTFGRTYPLTPKQLFERGTGYECARFRLAEAAATE